MQGFNSMGSAQRPLSLHAAAYNIQRHLTSAKTHRTFRAVARRYCKVNNNTCRQFVAPFIRLRDSALPHDTLPRLSQTHFQFVRLKRASSTLSS